MVEPCSFVWLRSIVSDNSCAFMSCNEFERYLLNRLCSIDRSILHIYSTGIYPSSSSVYRVSKDTIEDAVYCTVILDNIVNGDDSLCLSSLIDAIVVFDVYSRNIFDKDSSIKLADKCLSILSVKACDNLSLSFAASCLFFVIESYPRKHSVCSDTNVSQLLRLMLSRIVYPLLESRENHFVSVNESVISSLCQVGMNKLFSIISDLKNFPLVLSELSSFIMKWFDRLFSIKFKFENSSNVGTSASRSNFIHALEVIHLCQRCFSSEFGALFESILNNRDLLSSWIANVLCDDPKISFLSIQLLRNIVSRFYSSITLSNTWHWMACQVVSLSISKSLIGVCEVSSCYSFYTSILSINSNENSPVKKRLRKIECWDVDSKSDAMNVQPKRYVNAMWEPFLKEYIHLSGMLLGLLQTSSFPGWKSSVEKNWLFDNLLSLIFEESCELNLETSFQCSALFLISFRFLHLFFRSKNIQDNFCHEEDESEQHQDNAVNLTTQIKARIDVPWSFNVANMNWSMNNPENKHGIDNGIGGWLEINDQDWNLFFSHHSHQEYCKFIGIDNKDSRTWLRCWQSKLEELAMKSKIVDIPKELLDVVLFVINELIDYQEDLCLSATERNSVEKRSNSCGVGNDHALDLGIDLDIDVEVDMDVTNLSICRKENSGVNENENERMDHVGDNFQDDLQQFENDIHHHEEMESTHFDLQSPGRSNCSQSNGSSDRNNSVFSSPSMALNQALEKVSTLVKKTKQTIESGLESLESSCLVSLSSSMATRISGVSRNLENEKNFYESKVMKNSKLAYVHDSIDSFDEEELQDKKNNMLDNGNSRETDDGDIAFRMAKKKEERNRIEGNGFHLMKKASITRDASDNNNSVRDSNLDSTAWLIHIESLLNQDWFLVPPWIQSSNKLLREVESVDGLQRDIMRTATTSSSTNATTLTTSSSIPSSSSSSQTHFFMWESFQKFLLDSQRREWKWQGMKEIDEKNRENLRDKVRLLEESERNLQRRYEEEKQRRESLEGLLKDSLVEMQEVSRQHLNCQHEMRQWKEECQIIQQQHITMEQQVSTLIEEIESQKLEAEGCSRQQKSMENRYFMLEKREWEERRERSRLEEANRKMEKEHHARLDSLKREQQQLLAQERQEKKRLERDNHELQSECQKWKWQEEQLSLEVEKWKRLYQQEQQKSTSLTVELEQCKTEKQDVEKRLDEHLELINHINQVSSARMKR